MLTAEKSNSETIADARAEGAKIAGAADTWERDTRLAHAMGYASALLRHRLISVEDHSQLLAEFRHTRNAWQPSVPAPTGAA